jgi:acyl-CoA synthetase
LFVVKDIGATLDISPIIVSVGQDEPQIGHSFKEAISGKSCRTIERVDANAPAAVLFTSGTESQPKGAIHTHNTILFGERAFSKALSFDESDICFMASPVMHTTGFLHGVVMTLCTGGTLSLLDIFEGNRALEQMISHETTWTMGATTFLTDTVAAMRSKSIRLPNMRFFLCGGAPIPEGAVKLAADAGLRVLSVYGSTESPPHAVVLPKDPFANAWLSDGRPLPGIETRLVGEDQTDVGSGEEGEEWSRGPNTFLGYLDEPELTNNNMTEDGWYKSGDLARYLPDGSIRIVGRKKDVIIRGGQKISAREVEDILANLSSVKEVAVIPFPHDRLGEITRAVLATTHGTTITLDEVARFLASQGLAKYKWPERLLCWAALPKTASGKIQKLAIRRQVQELVQ